MGLLGVTAGQPAEPPRAGLVAWPGRGRLGLLLLPLIIGFAFWPGLGNGFAHPDDRFNFVDNPGYRGLGPGSLRWAWRAVVLGVYQPLSWMIFSAEHAVCGLDPRGYHAASLLLHAVNALALYALVREFLKRDGPWPGARGEGRVAAALSAGFFAVHPLRTEVVAWASCQPYLPCALLATLSVLCYLRAHEEGRPPRSGLLGAAFVLFWGSLLCKAASVSLPAVLVILDVYPLRRLGGGRGRWLGPEARQVWSEKVPFFALAAAFALLAARVRTVWVNDIPPRFVGAAARAAHACYAACFYPVRTALPVKLRADYQIPAGATPTDPVFLAAVAAVALVSAWLWRGRGRRPGRLAAWACYLAVLAPASGLVYSGSVLAADRYSYLAAMCWAPPLAAALRRPLRDGRAAARAFVIAGGLAVLGALAASTRAQCGAWRDPVSLWQSALEHGGRNDARVRNNLAGALALVGRNEEALHHYDAAVRLDPRQVTYRERGARVLESLGRLGESADRFADLVRAVPESLELRADLARVLMLENKYDEAVAQYREMANRWPGRADVHLRLGYALAKQGRFDDAVVPLGEAVRLRPDLAETHFELASAQERRGRLDEAIAQYSEALKIRPDYPEARRGLEAAAGRKRRERGGRGGTGSS